MTPPAVVSSVTLTPALPSWLRTRSGVSDAVHMRDASALPRVASSASEGGGSVLAVEELAMVKEMVDPDWRALECVRGYDLHDVVHLLRTIPSSRKCGNLLADLESDAVYGDGRRKYKGLGGRFGATVSTVDQ